MPDGLLTRPHDSMLQMEVSAVTEESLMDVSAEMEMETTVHPLVTSTPQQQQQQQKGVWGVGGDISSQNAENYMYRKGTWSATGSKTTN